MGYWGAFFFGTKDNILCEEIAKEHHVDVEKVKFEYGKMLTALGVKPDEKTSD